MFRALFETWKMFVNHLGPCSLRPQARRITRTRTCSPYTWSTRQSQSSPSHHLRIGPQLDRTHLSLCARAQLRRRFIAIWFHLCGALIAFGRTHGAAWNLRSTWMLSDHGVDFAAVLMTTKTFTVVTVATCGTSASNHGCA